MVITTAQRHAGKPEPRFWGGSNPACYLSEICDLRISDSGPASSSSGKSLKGKNMWKLYEDSVKSDFRVTSTGTEQVVQKCFC